MLTPVVDLAGVLLARRYRVVRLIHSGASGALYEAVAGTFRRPVVLKILHPALARDPARVDRFRAEAKAVVEVDHPHIVHFEDYVVAEEGRHCIAFERLAGETLRETLTRLGRITPERAAGIAIQMLAALGALHRASILHCGVRPESIFLERTAQTRDDFAKLIDFASSRVSGDGPISFTGAVVNSLAYTAPEQAFGLDLDHRGDLYSLAATVYVAVCGLKPCPDAPARPIAAVRGVPVALDSLGLGIDPAFSAIIMRGLAKNPTQRHESAEAMARELDAWLATRAELRAAARAARDERTPEGVAADDGEALEPPRRRRAWGLPLSAAAAAVVLAGAGWLSTTRPAPPVAAAATVAAPVAESTSTNPDAMAAYRAGVDAIRRAAGGAARRHFARAVELDPSFAAAHLRKVLATPTVTDAERENVRKAVQLRATLSEHDRDLLHAIEPWVGVPQDAPEVERRLTELAGRHESAEYHYQLCRFRVLAGKHARAIDACRSARELDDAFAGAYWLEGEARLFGGDTRAGVDAIDMCLRASPAATSCLVDLTILDSNEGRCASSLGYARRLVAIDPNNANALVELGIALAATGAPDAEIHDAYERGLALMPEDAAHVERDVMRVHASTARGDHAGALAALDEWDHAIEMLGDEGRHVRLFRERAALARAVARDADVVPAARSLLARRAAWSPSPTGDARLVALAALYRAGELSRADFRAVRDLAIRSTTALPWVVWLDAYADAIVTRDDASDAVQALPTPLPPERTRDARDDEALGRAYLRAGRASDAAPFLRRAANSCRADALPLQRRWALTELEHALRESASR